MKRTSLPLRRREFLSLLGGAAAAWPLTARAQQGGYAANRAPQTAKALGLSVPDKLLALADEVIE